ncbi:E1 ubiquitin-activating protein UBA2 [Pneumocystis jirovecii RU7]|uniref:Ubiquitin-activating enzyme E1-like n=1 Tax=Pneumocystis jirovecii (strain RU7) TaxID=1408657 RepID=A0A0W4ZFL8_PNEJ7|nr:E1 ubiquitin-activating protein UBA2 [Pneumocystis jirovecii RU7]KTW27147.1 hypothetical protein T551_03141 [Pneumocystis jirovecii RU7]
MYFFIIFKVLLVGAGGIGCELLKNLLLSGFKEIHIIDLDTIDLSNLNRQFLFQKKHIKKPKALIAKENAQKFNLKAKLEAYHSDIKDPKFDVFWFQKFTLVFNALDNLDARRHVNKMCLTANVPLIESGTAGFYGQVQVIIKGKTECYDCNPKEIPKTYPICTIRMTPSSPIHCIVWAKNYLFPHIFGFDENILDIEIFETEEHNINNLHTEKNFFKNIKDSIGNKDFPKRLFKKLYYDEIIELKSLEDISRILKTINPLSYEDLKLKSCAIDKERLKNGQLVWTIEENFHMFFSSLENLSKRFLSLSETSSNNKPVILFDKDDEDSLNFVSASANLRSYIFGIEQKSKFKIKQMAGNIIPSISTTNSIISGICALQAFHVLSNNLNSLKTVFYSRRPEKVFNSEAASPPNPQCKVCGVARSIFSTNIHLTTLKDLVIDVLQKGLGYGKEISIISDRLLYDIEFEDNLDKLLKDIGVQNGTFLTIIDEEDNEEEPNRKNLILVIEEKTFENAEKPYSILNISIPRYLHNYKTQENKTDEDNEKNISDLKRKSDLSYLESDTISKKTKTNHIIIDDDDSDVVILDST